jgi:hypothetical protein
MRKNRDEDPKRDPDSMDGIHCPWIQGTLKKAAVQDEIAHILPVISI